MPPAWPSRMPAPELHHVLRPGGQRPPGGEVAHQVPRRLRQRRLRRVGDLAIAHPPRRLVGDPRVDVARGPRHRPRAHRLAARRLHRLEERHRRLALGRVAPVGGVVVVAQAQREGVGGAARQQHLVARHPPRHLRQPHRARPRSPADRPNRRRSAPRSPAIARVASASAFLNGSAGLSAGLDMAPIDNRRRAERKRAQTPGALPSVARSRRPAAPPRCARRWPPSIPPAPAPARAGSRRGRSARTRPAAGWSASRVRVTKPSRSRLRRVVESIFCEMSPTERRKALKRIGPAPSTPTTSTVHLSPTRESSALICSHCEVSSGLTWAHAGASLSIAARTIRQ